jgi:rod shape-determining protein MreB
MISLLPWISEVAIDVGTANVHVAVKDGGVVVREPALVAYRRSSDTPVAFGTEAKQMLEQGVSEVRVVRPLQNGVVADLSAATTMLRHYLQKTLGRRPLFSPLVLTAYPTAATQVTRRALVRALRAAGAGRVVAVQKSLAAATGAGLAVDAVTTAMVIDIGAGTTDAAALSMGMISDGISVPLGGASLDETLIRSIKRQQGIRVSYHVAEEIKLHVGSVDRSLAATPPAGVASAGSFLDKADDIKAFGVQLDDVPDILHDACMPIAEELSWMIEQLPARVRSHLGTAGAVMTGGTSQLRGLSTILGNRTGIPMAVATDPMACTMLGLQAILNNLHSLSLDGKRVSFTD